MSETCLERTPPLLPLRIGGMEWQRLPQPAREAIVEMLGHLMAQYVRRESADPKPRRNHER